MAADLLKCTSQLAKETIMKVVKEPKDKSGKDLYTDKYEFRACGGSIEPEDRKEKAEKGQKAEDADKA